MRIKRYDHNGEKYYEKKCSSGFLSKIESWIFFHIGGCIKAVHPIDELGEECVEYPITPFISARKFKKLKAEAITLYPNDPLYFGLNKVLKAHGLIIR